MGCRKDVWKDYFASDDDLRQKCVDKIKKNGNMRFIGIEGKENGLSKAVIKSRSRSNAIIWLTEKGKMSNVYLGAASVEMTNKTMPWVNGLDILKIWIKMSKSSIGLEIRQKGLLVQIEVMS